MRRANVAEPSVPEVGVNVDAEARLGGFAGGLVERLAGEPIASVPAQADSSCLRVDVGPSELVRLDRDEEGFGGALVSVREGLRPLMAIRIGVANAVASRRPMGSAPSRRRLRRLRCGWSQEAILGRREVSGHHPQGVNCHV